MWSLISIVSDMYMKGLEDETMDITPRDTRPSMWRWYSDDSFKVVKQDKQDELIEHLNSIYTTTSIKFVEKLEMGGVSHF